MATLQYGVTIQDWYKDGLVNLIYSVSYDPIANKTTVTFNESWHRYYGQSGYLTAAYTTITVTADDSGDSATSALNTEGTTNGGQECFYGTPASVTVEHSQTAGAKQITIAGSTYVYPVYINGNAHSATGVGSVTVDAGEYYPASTLTVSNGTLGVSQTLEVERMIDSFTHTITYECGTASGTICTKSSNISIAWTPPLSLANQNTAGTSVAVKFTITTYTGDTVLGTNTASITCAIPDSVKPSFTVTVSDALGYADDFGGYVQTKSKLKIVVDVTTMYGASVVSVKVTANGETHSESDITTGALKNSGENTITVEVIDSRGRKASGNTSVTVLAYSHPAISLFNYNRCDSDGTDNVLGDYAEITFSNAVTSLSGKNAVGYTMEYKKTTDSVYSSVDMADFAGLYSVSSGTRIFAADAGSSYNVRLTVADSFGSAVATLLVSTGFAIMHWLPRGIGAAIGKIAELVNTLELGWRIHMNGNKITGLGDPSDDADAVTLKIAKGLHARNLLDNSDFTNLIAQAGILGNHGTDTYFADRWMINALGFTYDATTRVITFPSGGNSILYQKVAENVSGKALTIAIKASAVSGTVCLSENNAQAGHQDRVITEGITLYTFTGGDDLWAMIWSGGGSLCVDWIMLIEGEYTDETLPEYQPKGYGAELCECQRYYQIRSTGDIAAVDMRPTMRLASPTITSVTGGYSYSADL